MNDLAEQALRGLDRARRIDPFDADISVRMIALMVRQGRRGSARRVAREALDAAADFEGALDRDLLAAASRLGVDMAVAR